MAGQGCFRSDRYSSQCYVGWQMKALARTIGDWGGRSASRCWLLHRPAVCINFVVLACLLALRLPSSGFACLRLWSGEVVRMLVQGSQRASKAALQVQGQAGKLLLGASEKTLSPIDQDVLIRGDRGAGGTWNFGIGTAKTVPVRDAWGTSSWIGAGPPLVLETETCLLASGLALVFGERWWDGMYGGSGVACRIHS
ncbi:hypothetical protein DL98DRAFT_193206 [Cadophora sp. DSE1049]|nr:hypothetical protein DL98DRAFT_193206 [Cadophora sp. DSE1049]